MRRAGSSLREQPSAAAETAGAGSSHLRLPSAAVQKRGSQAYLMKKEDLWPPIGYVDPVADANAAPKNGSLEMEEWVICPTMCSWCGEEIERYSEVCWCEPCIGYGHHECFERHLDLDGMCRRGPGRPDRPRRPDPEWNRISMPQQYAPTSQMEPQVDTSVSWQEAHGDYTQEASEKTGSPVAMNTTISASAGGGTVFLLRLRNTNTYCT